MNRKNIFLILSLFSLIIPRLEAGDAGGVLQFPLEFPISQIRVETVCGWNRIVLPGCETSLEPGFPELPVKTVQVALPPRTTLTGWRVEEGEWKTLPQKVRLFPVQKPGIISITPGNLSLAYSKAFPREKPYPARTAGFAGRGQIGEREIVEFQIHPARFNAAPETVKICKNLTLLVFYRPSRSGKTSPSCTGEVLKDLLLNPWPSPDEVASKGEKGRYLPRGDVEYLVVTPGELAAAFQPLADWKTKKGVPAGIVTTEEISSHSFPGDTPSQIRTFLKHARADWGVRWVLLGGDTTQVPERRTWAMDSGRSANANAIPCDHYYADLDGDWDADGDGTYGEVEDNVDLYTDLFVGRAPVKNIAEARDFVQKVLEYEKSPSADYVETMLFFAQIEDYSPYTDSSESTEMIDENYVPERFDPITKLYQSDRNETHDTVMAELQKGYQFVNHTGHAGYSYLSAGESGQRITREDADLLTNGSRLSILYSTGCWPGAFDLNCMAERLLNNPGGGAIACLFNSRYGWYAPGNPRFGYSDRFNQLYYRALFQEGKYRLGENLAWIKAFYIPRSRVENVYRWHQYELNLFGDPEMPVWTGQPRDLEASHPFAIPCIPHGFDIRVRSGQIPVPGARICFSRSDEPGLYQTGLTDDLGTARFTLDPDLPGILDLVITARNHIPLETTIAIQTKGKFTSLGDLRIDDDNEGQSEGNNDGMINPGERIELELTLENTGYDNIPGGTATLLSSDPMVAPVQSIRSFPDIPTADSGPVPDPFVFSVNDRTTDTHVLDFTLELEDGKGEIFRLPFSLITNRPVIRFADYTLDDSPGNGNGLAEPGEKIHLTLFLRNIGTAPARNVSTEVFSDSSGWIDIINGGIAFDTIDPGQERPSSETVELLVDPACPFPAHLHLPLEIRDEFENRKECPLLIPIGGTGLEEDFETSPVLWDHAGSFDQWHRDQNRVLSGTYGFYCGNSTTRRFENWSNDELVSPAFILPLNAELSFWRWYHVPLYGTNGLYVQIELGNDWRVLDFIGSGGALPKNRDLKSDWYRESYDLSSFPPGIKTRIRFRFSSDDETPTEGFYLDDILVRGAGGPAPPPTPTWTPTPTPTPFVPWRITDSFPSGGAELPWGYIFKSDEVVEFSPPCPDGDGYVYRVGDTFGWDSAFLPGWDYSNYYVQAYLYLPVDHVTSDWERLGLFLRGQSCSEEGHNFSYALTMDTDDGRTRAGKYLNGDISAFRDNVYTPAGWHKLRIEARDNRIRFLVDDKLFMEKEDNTFGSGGFGFSHKETGTRDTVYYTKVDNFEAGSIPTATPTPPPVSKTIWEIY